MQEECRGAHGFPPGRPFRDLSSEPAPEQAEQEEPDVVGADAAGREEQGTDVPTISASMAS